MRSINTNSYNNTPPEQNKPEKVYEDPINQRNLIRHENNGKIGVYT
jgi:hypothetical protein